MTMPRDISCDEIRRRLVPFADGELERALRETVEQHIRSCVACRREHEELTASLEAFLALGREAAPRPAREALADDIIRNAETEGPRTSVIRFIPAAAAAILVLGLTLAILWQRGLFSRPRPSSLPAPIAIQQHAPAALQESPAEERIARGLFEARLAAVQAAAVVEAQPAPPPVPDACLTATELYAQIPAIMLCAADQVNYAAGDKVEAARKYERIVKLFPESKQARTAAVRLAQLR